MRSGCPVAIEVWSRLAVSQQDTLLDCLLFPRAEGISKLGEQIPGRSLSLALSVGY
jgi:hypothetical protein